MNAVWMLLIFTITTAQARCFDDRLPRSLTPPAISSRVESLMKQGKLQNLSFVMGNSQGIIHADNFGPHASSKSLYDLASLTKLFTATTLMRILEREPKYSIKTPVNQILEVNFPDKLTIERLLRHESGLPIGLSKGASTEAGLLRVRFNPRLFGKFQYGDVNYMLLAKIIEKLDGTKLEQAIQNNVTDDLGVNDTLFNPRRDDVLPSSLDARTGTPHDPVARRFGGIAGHAGLFSSVQNLASFASVFLNDGEFCNRRILKSKTISAMTQLSGSSLRGLGFDIMSVYSRLPRANYFSLGNSFGHTGFAGASIWIDKTRDLFIIFLGNATYSKDIVASKKAFYQVVGHVTRRTDSLLKASLLFGAYK